MTVRFILEDIAIVGEPGSVDALSDLHFVAFGGGLIQKSVGEKLSSARVKLLNHYGTTEIGPISPIFIPPKDYDYLYSRLSVFQIICISE